MNQQVLDILVQRFSKQNENSEDEQIIVDARQKNNNQWNNFFYIAELRQFSTILNGQEKQQKLLNFDKYQAVKPTLYIQQTCQNTQPFRVLFSFRKQESMYYNKKPFYESQIWNAFENLPISNQMDRSRWKRISLIHQENKVPIANFTKAIKIITVSHWGYFQLKILLKIKEQSQKENVKEFNNNLNVGKHTLNILSGSHPMILRRYITRMKLEAFQHQMGKIYMIIQKLKGENKNQLCNIWSMESNFTFGYNFNQKNKMEIILSFSVKEMVSDKHNFQISSKKEPKRIKADLSLQWNDPLFFSYLIQQDFEQGYKSQFYKKEIIITCQLTGASIQESINHYTQTQPLHSFSKAYNYKD